MTQTPNLDLNKPAEGNTNWADDVNDNWDTLDTNIPKSNFSASAAPTGDDDTTEGYSVGSRWFDTTNDQAYVCLDASYGSAIWKQTTEGGTTGGVDVLTVWLYS